ncbi:MAG: DUF2855 family protein [Alphaproteobacteria bacterium]
MSTPMITVDKTNPADAKLTFMELYEINDGQVRVRVEQFGFSANNVTYGVAGDFLGYWQFFPANEPERGIIPVWGYGKVIESAHDDVRLGERLFGYFPMGADVILSPGNISDAALFDMAPHRSQLPPVYNQYVRIKNEATDWSDIEAARMLLSPVIITSYVLYDYEHDADFFGAEQIIIASASSKTAIGLAQMLSEDTDKKVKTIGLTSATNKGFVEGLGFYDQVLTYDQIDALPNVASAFVDMSGNGVVVAGVHNHLADNLKDSCIVGMTHWDQGRAEGELPGPPPTMFFAPTEIAKKVAELGPEEATRRRDEKVYKIIKGATDWLTINQVSGGNAAVQVMNDFVANKISPDQGYVLTVTKD